MSTQRYLYWHPGEEKPKAVPLGLQHLTAQGTWDTFDSDLCGWVTNTRRWPVTEAEYRTYHYCRAYNIAYNITIPKGWRVVDFKAAVGHWFLDLGGNAFNGSSCGVMVPILERIEEWIIPTDEDAKRRPMVQVRDDEDQEWIAATLYGVCNDQFITNPTKCGMVWSQCRMKKETAQ